MHPVAGERQEIHQHSGWLIPAGFGMVTLVLCGLILGWYLRPYPQAGSPSGGSQIVHLSIHGMRLGISANYIATASAGAGGAQEKVSLVALFPSFHGYSLEEASLFRGNAPDSPVIRLSLRGDTPNLSARERLDRVYRPYITNLAGTEGPFGLTRYDFAQRSGYGDSELFAGMDAQGLELFLCEKAGPDIPSPNCLALDRPLGRQASLSWRFKRAYLARWREVAGGVHGLIARFERSG